MRRWRFPEPGPSQLVSERGTSQGEEPLVGHDYEDDDEQRGEKLASIERSTESVRDRLMLNAEIWSIRSKLDLELAEIRSKFDREQAAIKSRFDLEKVGIKSEFAMYYTQFQLFLSRTGASADAHQVSDAGTQRTRSTIEKNKVRFQQATTVLTIPSMSSAAKFAKSMEAHSISSRPIPSSSLSTIVQEQASMAVKVILQSQADRVQLAGRSPNSKGIVKKKKKMKNWSIWQEIDDCEMYPIFDPGGVVGRRNLEEKIGGGMNSLLCEKVENSTGPSFDPRMFKWPLPGSKNGDNGEPEGFILSYKLESEELTADIGDRETFFAGNQLVVNAENSAWKRANEISEGIPEVTVDRGMGAEKLEVVLFETMGEEVIGGQEINMVNYEEMIDDEVSTMLGSGNSKPRGTNISKFDPYCTARLRATHNRSSSPNDPISYPKYGCPLNIIFDNRHGDSKALIVMEGFRRPKSTGNMNPVKDGNYNQHLNSLIEVKEILKNVRRRSNIQSTDHFMSYFLFDPGGATYRRCWAARDDPRTDAGSQHTIFDPGVDHAIVLPTYKNWLKVFGPVAVGVEHACKILSLISKIQPLKRGSTFTEFLTPGHKTEGVDIHENLAVDGSVGQAHVVGAGLEDEAVKFKFGAVIEIEEMDAGRRKASCFCLVLGKIKKLQQIMVSSSPISIAATGEAFNCDSGRAVVFQYVHNHHVIMLIACNCYGSITSENRITWEFHIKEWMGVLLCNSSEEHFSFDPGKKISRRTESLFDYGNLQESNSPCSLPFPIAREELFSFNTGGPKNEEFSWIFDGASIEKMEGLEDAVCVLPMLKLCAGGKHMNFDIGAKRIVQHMIGSATATWRLMSGVIMRITTAKVACCALEEEISEAIIHRIEMYFPAKSPNLQKLAVLQDVLSNICIDQRSTFKVERPREHQNFLKEIHLGLGSEKEDKDFRYVEINFGKWHAPVSTSSLMVPEAEEILSMEKYDRTIFVFDPGGTRRFYRSTLRTRSI